MIPKKAKTIMTMTNILPTMWTKPCIFYLSISALFATTLKMNTSVYPNCNILTWNVRGIFSTAGSLSQTLDDLRIDVAFISEHKLKQQHKEFLNSMHSEYVSHAVFDTSNTPGSRCGKGGACILYKKQCSFQITPIIGIPSERICGISITQPDACTIYAFSVYMPSVNYSIADYKDCLHAIQSIYDSYSQLGTVILCGDFNASLSENMPNERNKLFSDFLKQNNLFVVNNSGEKLTFRQTEKTLDHVILPKHQATIVKSSRILNDDIFHVSDHLPIYTCVHVPVTAFHPKITPQVAWHKCTDENFNMYRHALTNELQTSDLSNITEASSGNQHIESLYNHIVKSIRNASNLTLPISHFNKHSKPYWTASVKEAHADQRAKRLAWIKAGRPRDPSNLHYKSYKSAKREFRKVQTDAIRQTEQRFYNDLDETANCDIRLFWKTLNYKRKKTKPIINEITTDGDKSNVPLEICQAFKQHFASAFVPHDELNFDNVFKVQVDEKVNTFYKSNDHSDCPILSCPVGFNELHKALSRLKRRKAPGIDLIVNEHLIHGGSLLLQYLKALFNLMIEHEYIPSDHKIGIVIPIHKVGKPRDATDSYRPITLLSVIYKLFEKIVHMRLQEWCSLSHKSFPNGQQNGYQKNLDSITTSFTLQETIAYNRELGSDSYVAFLDTAKAFDTVWHNGLFAKLLEFGIHGKFLRIIMNCYQNNYSCVLVNGMKSEVFPVMQGVRQGGIISTWMYLLYVDELLNTLQDSEYSASIASIKCGNPTLADDIALVCPSIHCLQQLLDIVYTYSVKWRYTLNPSKCKILAFTNKKLVNLKQVKLGNEIIAYHEEATHVGIQLNRSLNSSTSIEARCRKSRASLFSILNSYNLSTNVNPLTIASILNKVTIPVLLYGAELWCSVSRADACNVEKLVRLAAKCCQNLPIRASTIMTLSMIGWLPASAQIDMRKLRFLHRLC
ncbi:MAG: reverse transcriptase family protein, partial [Sedimenticola sp.]